MSQAQFKPYLLRAFHEWLTEIGQTPQILVNCSVEGVNVPTGQIKDNRIILNVSYSAAHNLFITNTELTFGAKFGGNQLQCKVPMDAVLLIYSRETNDSIPFATTKDLSVISSQKPQASDPMARNFLSPESPKMAPEVHKNRTQHVMHGASKRDASHLTVIK